nr:PREDICTED: uncharacterized protein LOC107077197 [Lepisosteus oculatus]
MRNPTWSRAANDNYVTILQAPPSAESRQDCVSENGSSTSSQSSVVRDQTLTGAESKNREVDQNIFVSVPPWYPHCLSDTHQHFRGEDNQGLTLPPCHEGQDVSGHLTSRPEEETAPSTDHLKGDLEAKNAILGPGFNQQPSNLNEVKDLQQPEGYSHSMEEDGNVGHQEPSRLLPSSAVSETGSAWVKNTGDIEEDLAVREKDVNSTVWEPFPFRDHSASFEGQLDRSQVLVHDSQAPAATRREGAEWTSQQAPAEERDAVNFYYSSGLVAEQKTSASSSAGSAQSEPGDLQKAELLSGGTPTGRSDSCCLDPWTAPSRDAEQFGRSDQMSNILDTHKETDHKTLKGFPELTEGILRQLSPEFDSEFWNDSGESFEFSDSNVEDNMNATLFSDFNLAQQLKMERWSPFGGPTPNEPREDESNSEVQNGSFNSSPDLSRHCPERTKFSEKQPAANLQVIDNREWGNRITSNTCENADYDGNLNSSPTFNLDSESTLHLEKCCTGAFSTQHTTVPHGGDFLCPDSPSFKDMEEDAENAKTEEARESDQHGHLALDRTKSSMEEHEAAGWTVFNCNPTLQSFSGETGEMTEWPPAPTEAGADDFHAASPPGGTPQNASPQSTRSPPSEMWSDLILPDEMFATRPRHLESEVAETDSSLSQDSSGSSATLVNSEGIPTTEEDFSESPRLATGPGEDEQVDTQLLRHQEPVEAWLSAPAGERRETVQSFSHCKQKLDWTKGGYFVQKRKIMDTFSAGFYSSVSKTTEASRKGCEEENTPSAAHASRIRSESSGAPMSGSTVTFSAGQLQGEPAYISPREITETEKPLGASSPKACERGWGGSRGPEGPLLALPTSSPEEQPGSPAAPLFLSEARSNEGSEA